MSISPFVYLLCLIIKDVMNFILPGAKIVEHLQLRQYGPLTKHDSFTGIYIHSWSIVIWFTRWWRLYVCPFPNLSEAIRNLSLSPLIASRDPQLWNVFSLPDGLCTLCTKRFLCIILMYSFRHLIRACTGFLWPLRKWWMIRCLAL